MSGVAGKEVTDSLWLAADKTWTAFCLSSEYMRRQMHNQTQHLCLIALRKQGEVKNQKNPNHAEAADPLAGWCFPCPFCPAKSWFSGNFHHCGIDATCQQWMENADVVFSQTLLLFRRMGDCSFSIPSPWRILEPFWQVVLQQCFVLCCLQVCLCKLGTQHREEVCGSEGSLFPSYSPSAVLLSVQRITQDFIPQHRTPISQMCSLGDLTDQ